MDSKFCGLNFCEIISETKFMGPNFCGVLIFVAIFHTLYSTILDILCMCIT